MSICRSCCAISSTNSVKPAQHEPCLWCGAQKDPFFVSPPSFVWGSVAAILGATRKIGRWKSTGKKIRQTRRKMGISFCSPHVQLIFFVQLPPFTITHRASHINTYIARRFGYVTEHEVLAKIGPFRRKPQPKVDVLLPQLPLRSTF